MHYYDGDAIGTYECPTTSKITLKKSVRNIVDKKLINLGFISYMKCLQVWVDVMIKKWHFWEVHFHVGTQHGFLSLCIWNVSPEQKWRKYISNL